MMLATLQWVVLIPFGLRDVAVAPSVLLANTGMATLFLVRTAVKEGNWVTNFY